MGWGCHGGRGGGAVEPGAPTSNTTPAAVALSEAKSAGTPAGTVTAPVFSGASMSVLNPFLVVYMWARTA